MTQPAVLTIGLNNPGYLRLVELLQRAGVTMIACEAQVADAWRREGIRAECLDASLPSELRTRLETRAARLAAAVTHRVEPMGNSPAGIPGLSTLSAHELEATVLRAAKEFLLVIEYFEMVRSRWPVGAVLLGYDMSGPSHALALRARALGIPSVHLPHAVFGRWPGMEHGLAMRPLRADYAAVAGTFQRDYYLDQGASPEQLIITGAPRWDLYAKCPRTAAARAAACTALGLDPARPVLLLAATWVERTASNCLEQIVRLLVAYRQVFRAAAALADRGVQLLIKLHPGELSGRDVQATAISEGYRALAAAAGLKSLGLLAERKIEGLLAADVVMTFDSNLGIEALLLDKPLVNLSLFDSERHALFGSNDAVIHCRYDSDLSDPIARALFDPSTRADLAARRPGSIKRYNFLADGRAAERVADLVLRLVNNPAKNATPTDDERMSA